MQNHQTATQSHQSSSRKETRKRGVEEDKECKWVRKPPLFSLRGWRVACEPPPSPPFPPLPTPFPPPPPFPPLAPLPPLPPLLFFKFLSSPISLLHRLISPLPPFLLLLLLIISPTQLTFKFTPANRRLIRSIFESQFCTRFASTQVATNRLNTNRGWVAHWGVDEPARWDELGESSHEPLRSRDGAEAQEEKMEH